MLLLYVCAACLASTPAPATRSGFGRQVEDGVLAAVRGPVSPAVAREAHPDAPRPIALMAVEQMDIWWANDGLALIAASRDLARGTGGVAPLTGIIVADGGITIDHHLLDRAR